MIWKYIYIYSISYRWILYQTWWSSMAMFNYQRVNSGFSDFLGFLTFRQTHVVIFSVMAVNIMYWLPRWCSNMSTVIAFDTSVSYYLSIANHEERIPQKLMESIIIFPRHIQLYIVGDVCMQNTTIWPMPLHSHVYILIILWPPLWHINHICWVRIPSNHHSVTWWYCFWPLLLLSLIIIMGDVSYSHQHIFIINYPKLPIIVIIKPPIISGHFGYDSP